MGAFALYRCGRCGNCWHLDIYRIHSVPSSTLSRHAVSLAVHVLWVQLFGRPGRHAVPVPTLWQLQRGGRPPRATRAAAQNDSICGDGRGTATTAKKPFFTETSPPTTSGSQKTLTHGLVTAFYCNGFPLYSPVNVFIKATNAVTSSEVRFLPSWNSAMTLTASSRVFAVPS